MNSNRFNLVDREMISGLIEGVCFGPAMLVIVRSPKALLLWSLAHSYSINGFREYAAPGLMLISSRDRPPSGRLPYTRLIDGGRLSAQRVKQVEEKIREVFGIGSLETMWIDQAVKDRKTLLIEGGGPPLMPAQRLGVDAYNAWKAIPNRGFINQK